MPDAIELPGGGLGRQQPATAHDGVPAGVVPSHYLSLNGQAGQVIDGAVVAEFQACISVNGIELAHFMCSPGDLDQLAYGFLYNEGLIDSLDDVHHLHLSDDGACADVWLRRDFEPPERLIVTAGCGGGVTFDDLSAAHAPLQHEASATPAELAGLMRSLHLGARLYQAARGIHTAALAERQGILLQVEDIGRHNCLDRLRGAALLAGMETGGRILLSSGRISSEMINKARRLATPIVCSRTSPTSLSVALAEAWNMTIVAYLRQDRMRVYTHPERLGLAAGAPAPSEDGRGASGQRRDRQPPDGRRPARGGRRGRQQGGSA